MKDTTVSGKGLPPGLWLPTAEESTDRFLKEAFNRTDHPYEEIIELGMFAVALASFDQKRVSDGSLMPSRLDLVELFKEGYGIDHNRIQRHYGGFSRLQEALGFYPRDHRPQKGDLVKRLSWFTSWYLPVDDSFKGSSESIDDVLEWGMKRRLLPSRAIIEEVLDSDRRLLKMSLGIEKPKTKEMYTVMDAYRLAARVIRECGGPITQAQLNKKYAGEFEVLPNQIVQTFCGSLGALWLEFGYVADTTSFNADDLVNIGVRHAIRTGKAAITRGDIDSLSAAKRFPSRMPIRTSFNGSTKQYQDAVQQEYGQYLLLQSKLQEMGVSTEVCVAASRRYCSSSEFSEYLLTNAETLALLSDGSSEANYVLSILKRGFDIEHEVTMRLQCVDLKRALKRLGIATEQQRRFIFELIPHVSYDDMSF